PRRLPRRLARGPPLRRRPARRPRRHGARRPRGRGPVRPPPPARPPRHRGTDPLRPHPAQETRRATSGVWPSAVASVTPGSPIAHERHEAELGEGLLAETLGAHPRDPQHPLPVLVADGDDEATARAALRRL